MRPIYVSIGLKVIKLWWSVACKQQWGCRAGVRCLKSVRSSCDLNTGQTRGQNKQYTLCTVITKILAFRHNKWNHILPFFVFILKINNCTRLGCNKGTEASNSIFNTWVYLRTCGTRFQISKCRAAKMKSVGFFIFFFQSTTYGWLECELGVGRETQAGLMAST